MKIRLVGAALFHTDRWTDRHDESNCRFFAILRTRVRIVQLVNNASPQSIMSRHYIKSILSVGTQKCLGPQINP